MYSGNVCGCMQYGKWMLEFWALPLEAPCLSAFAFPWSQVQATLLLWLHTPLCGVHMVIMLNPHKAFEAKIRDCPQLKFFLSVGPRKGGWWVIHNHGRGMWEIWSQNFHIALCTGSQTKSWVRIRVALFYYSLFSIARFGGVWILQPRSQTTICVAKFNPQNSLVSPF